MAKTGEIQPKRGPTTTQVLAVVTLLPLAASLLCLAVITLAGTLMSLAVAAPLFLICSPVLIPAAILIAGAVTGILTSGAFGLTGLSSVLWVFDSFRRATGQGPFEYAMRRTKEVIFKMGKMVKMAGEKMKREQTKQSKMLGTKFVKIG